MRPALRDLVAETRRGRAPDPVAVLRLARSRRLSLDREDLRQLLLLAGMPEVFAVPTLITDFLCAYLRTRQRRRLRLIVDLWAAAGWVLPHLVDELRPARAIGNLADRRTHELAELLDPTGAIAWSADDAGALATGLEPGVDVVVGCPPWRWQPRPFRLETADGPVLLTDDPANIALLEACARLSRDGIGLFIVGPGFLMRPGPGTVFANLERFGLSLHLVLELPRGMFSPDSGSGRLLVGIGAMPCPSPLIDSLTPDPQHTAALLDAASARSANGRKKDRDAARGDALSPRSSS